MRNYCAGECLTRLTVLAQDLFDANDLPKGVGRYRRVDFS
jgi:hypothetical protein